MPLTDVAIRKAAPKTKPYKLADGGGLYLLINPNGSKWWRWDYRFRGFSTLRGRLLQFGDYQLAPAGP